MLTAQEPELYGNRVELERYPAAPDTDTATLQTIELMCRYIRESAADPMIQAAGAYALERFGGNSEDPAMRAWAVFWFVKHHVRFVVDEAPMFKLGEQGNQDLLISPAVLIRMDDPAEDCDGFTMLGAALLKALGVPFVIVTLAVDPTDPERWSHVFLMAQLPASLPMDMSHGSGPGWMVPASHTFRWQAWDENGKQVNVPRPRKHALNGWVKSGLGQDDSIDPESGLPYSEEYSGATAPTLMTGPTPPSSVLTPASTSSGFNWTSFANSLATDATQTAQTYIKVQGQEQLAQEGAYTASGVLSSVLPIALLALGAWFVISMMESKH